MERPIHKDAIFLAKIRKLVKDDMYYAALYYIAEYRKSIEIEVREKMKSEQDINHSG